jgi:hypothetical protein
MRYLTLCFSQYLPAAGGTLWQEGAMQQDHDSHSSRKEDKQGQRQLCVDGHGKTGVPFHERPRQWTRGQARQEGEPTVCDRQRPLVYEKDQTTEASDSRPGPTHALGGTSMALMCIFPPKMMPQRIRVAKANKTNKAGCDISMPPDA